MNKKPYLITRENDFFIVTVRTPIVSEVLTQLNEIEKIINFNSFQGVLILDCLMSQGFEENRFLFLDYKNKDIDKRKFKIYTPTKDFIINRNNFIRKNCIIELKNSILASTEQDEILKGNDFIERHKKPTIKELMEDKPYNWGLRGDPYLWKEIIKIYGNHTITPEEIEYHIAEWFFDITKNTLDTEDYIYIERFAHGGMSSGGISAKFWRTTVLPKLIERIHKYY